MLIKGNAVRHRPLFFFVLLSLVSDVFKLPFSGFDY